MSLRASLVGGTLFVVAASLSAALTLRAAPEQAMAALRQRLVACPLPGLRCAPPGTFLHQRAIGPPPDAALGPADPNILVSSAWIDLGDGPYRLSVPAFGPRFFAIQIRDGRDDLVGVASARTIGRDGGTLTIERADANAVTGSPVRVTTRHAWIVASIAVEGERDEAAVAALQDGLRLMRGR